jgi:alkylated DNA repair dioxygenase AlkB
VKRFVQSVGLSSSDVFRDVDSQVTWIPSHELIFTIYGKHLQLPRRKAFSARYDGSEFPFYKYPGYLDRAPCDFMDQPIILDLATEIEKRFGQRVNHCVINKYRNGSDHISYHHDKVPSIAEGTKIFTISLGVKRTLSMKSMTKGVKTESVDLEDGSIFCLSSYNNLSHKHAIMKRKNINSERISLTFRTMSMYGTIGDNGKIEITRMDSGDVMSRKKRW